MKEKGDQEMNEGTIRGKFSLRKKAPLPSDYQKKVEIIRNAINSGVKLFIKTDHLGKLEVTGIVHRGDWAIVGKDWSRKSFAISSTEINGWLEELRNDIARDRESK